MRLVVNGTQSAHGVRAGAATRSGTITLLGLAELLLTASVAFAGEIEVVMFAISVTKYVHAM